jgi:hypothetical protein
MADKIYPKGIVTFSPRDGAPDFVKGTIIINPNELFAWLKENSLLLTEYNGKKQLKLQLLSGTKGLYTVVDNYVSAPKNEAPAPKPEPKKEPEWVQDDLPF